MDKDWRNVYILVVTATCTFDGALQSCTPFSFDTKGLCLITTLRLGNIYWAVTRDTDTGTHHLSFYSMSSFSDMTSGKYPDNWLQSLPRVCLSHMHNTAGGFLHRRVHNSNKSSAFVRREVEQPGAADRGRR